MYFSPDSVAVAVAVAVAEILRNLRDEDVSFFLVGPTAAGTECVLMIQKLWSVRQSEHMV